MQASCLKAGSRMKVTATASVSVPEGTKEEEVDKFERKNKLSCLQCVEVLPFALHRPPFTGLDTHEWL